jgi:hypothetical protein
MQILRFVLSVNGTALLDNFSDKGTTYFYIEQTFHRNILQYMVPIFDNLLIYPYSSR